MLSREPNLFVVRPQQQRENAAANHRPLIYELDQRGIRVLQERGVLIQRPRAPANFAHELMVCQIMASLDLGARERGARLIIWPDILNSRSLPDATRHSPRPFHIPVRFEGNDFHIAADAQPFGVERSIAGQRSYYFCPGIEADCGTEPVDASDFARSPNHAYFQNRPQAAAARISQSFSGRHSGRATPARRATPKAAAQAPTGRGSTYQGRKPVQAKPARSLNCLTRNSSYRCRRAAVVF